MNNLHLALENLYCFHPLGNLHSSSGQLYSPYGQLGITQWPTYFHLLENLHSPNKQLVFTQCQVAFILWRTCFAQLPACINPLIKLHSPKWTTCINPLGNLHSPNRQFVFIVARQRYQETPGLTFVPPQGI